jgi:hypothetical protein
MEVVFATEPSPETPLPSLDLSGWQESDEHICRACGNPARINPKNSFEWGCGQCGFITHSVFLFFKEKAAA